MSTVLLIGTLDTKAREYEFVRAELTAAGADVILMDVGILGASAILPDISSREVASAAGTDLIDLQFSREGSDTRAVALKTMQLGATRLTASLVAEGRCSGVLGLGGSGGTALISGVMRSLPLGMPKLIVSTMTSGDVSAYVGSTDISLMHSVTDIAGINRISQPILANAARAMAGMVAAPARSVAREQRPAVGVSMLGVTTLGATRVAEGLTASGFDPVIFHAVGSGGRALEQMLDQGVLAGVIDYTIKEVTDELFGGVFSAGARRLLSAGERGLPQLVVPGAIEVLNFGRLETVPAHLRDGSRPLVQHNDDVTAVRLTAEELESLALTVGQRLNRSRGATQVLIPARGFDAYSAEGGPFWDAEADARFIDRLISSLDARIPVRVVDAHINDASFADDVVATYLAMNGKN
jgi:uncharacterized protein (UPF0261 family)